tara:strand:- start:471 stop:1334 length:864 start_codon:yes stop_codon:yes gene_type:complete
MPKVSKVSIQHFDIIFPLLNSFDNSHSKEQWKHIFQQPFNNGEDNCGYALFDDEKVVGFLGYIYSEKLIGNKLNKFCNLTTWVVDEEYRNNSLQLIYPILKMKDYCITNYIPAKNVYDVSKKLGFKDLDVFENIILPVINPIKCFYNNCSFITKLDDITAFLEKAKDLYLLKVVNQHKLYRCSFVLIKSKLSYSLILFTRTKRKKITFANIQFISNKKLFYTSLDRFKIMLMWRFKIISPIIENRNLIEGNQLLSIKLKFKNPQIYRGEINDTSMIDNLFSELILLN